MGSGFSSTAEHLFCMQNPLISPCFNMAQCGSVLDNISRSDWKRSLSEILESKCRQARARWTKEAASTMLGRFSTGMSLRTCMWTGNNTYMHIHMKVCKHDPNCSIALLGLHHLKCILSYPSFVAKLSSDPIPGAPG